MGQSIAPLVWWRRFPPANLGSSLAPAATPAAQHETARLILPTVGWVLEGAIERFWEGRDRSRAARAAPPPVVCQHCGLSFPDRDSLLSHYSAVHPVALPGLYVAGRPLLSETILRTALSPNDIVLAHANRCEVQVDGTPSRSIAPTRLPDEFSRATNGTWQIRLVNDRAADGSSVHVDYHVRFRIADPRILNAVDESFVGRLARDELTHSDLEDFAGTLPRTPAEAEYGGALGDYALGLLIKEGRAPARAPIAFEEFATKLKSALAVLDEFDRPVALAVTGAIRFILNDFANEAPTAAEIALGRHFFRELITGSVPLPAIEGEEEPTRAVCPVDAVTHRLLRASRRMVLEGRLAGEDVAALERITAGGNGISGQDVEKAHAILAAYYLKNGDHPMTQRHCRAIQFGGAIRDWAQQQLETDQGDGILTSR